MCTAFCLAPVLSHPVGQESVLPWRVNGENPVRPWPRPLYRIRCLQPSQASCPQNRSSVTPPLCGDRTTPEGRRGVSAPGHVSPALKSPQPGGGPRGRGRPESGRGSAGRKSEKWPGGGGSGGGPGASPGCPCVQGRPVAHPHGAEAAPPELSAEGTTAVGPVGGREGWVTRTGPLAPWWVQRLCARVGSGQQPGPVLAAIQLASYSGRCPQPAGEGWASTQSPAHVCLSEPRRCRALMRTTRGPRADAQQRAGR